MTSKLYRKEALEAQTQRLFGEVLLIRPISFWLLTIGIMIIVIAVGMFLYFGEFARRETVSGHIISDQGVVRVVAPFNGTIENIKVIDGQKVQKGDVLFSVSTKKDSLDNLSVNQQLINQLISKQANLNQRITDEDSVYESEKLGLIASIKSAKLELAQLNLQEGSNKQQLDLSNNQKLKYEDLKEQGLVLEQEMVSKQTNYLNNKSNFETTKRLVIAKQNEISNLEKNLEQLPLRKSNRLQELLTEKIQLEENLIQLKSNQSYTVKSTVNGQVTSLQVHNGQTVTQTVSLLTIIPENTTLYVELFLPSKAIGFVNENQKVMIRYDAFPYQKYGLYEGHIVQVAQAVIRPNEAEIPLPTQEPVYRVRVAVESQTINAYGKQVSLQAGMTVSADIILEQRSLGEWLLAPIYSLKGRI